MTVPARSRFEVPGASGDVVVFETVSAIDLVPYLLDTVQVLDGTDYQDYSKANERGNDSFRPFGWLPQPGNALYLGLKPDDKEVPEDGDTHQDLSPRFPEQVVLRIFRPPPSPTDRSPVSRGDAPARRSPPQRLVWEYQSRLDLAEGQSRDMLDRWRPLTVVNDETLAFAREGNIVLRGPRADLLASRVGKPVADDKPRYWLRCRLASGLFARDNMPEIAFIRTNVTEVEALATYTDEVLGESDGFQSSFTLRNQPVVAESLDLRVEGVGDDDRVWTQVEDFLASGASDTHYTLNPNSGAVQFGDGRNGQLPPPGGLVVARTYIAGGGAAGNVPADAINSPPAGVAGIDKVTNPRPAVGGQDEETLDRLKERAPRAIRGDNRAVTLDDYRRFAEDVPGVDKANAIAQWHPDYPGLPVPGAVTVVVVPDDPPVGPDGASLEPLPTQDLLDLIVSRLNQLRMVGSELFVTGPDYRKITIKVARASVGQHHRGAGEGRRVAGDRGLPRPDPQTRPNRGQRPFRPGRRGCPELESARHGHEEAGPRVSPGLAVRRAVLPDADLRGGACRPGRPGQPLGPVRRPTASLGRPTPDTGRSTGSAGHVQGERVAVRHGGRRPLHRSGRGVAVMIDPTSPIQIRVPGPYTGNAGRWPLALATPPVGPPVHFLVGDRTSLRLPADPVGRASA